MTFPYPKDDQIFIFTSHAWAHLHRRDALTNLLVQPWVKDEDFFDLSVTSRHPIDSEHDWELGLALRERVRVSDALLITAGMYLLDRPWMKFEIDMAFAFDRPIIPVIFNGQERVPKIARQFAWCDPVRWRGDSVREAILRFLPAHRREAFEAKLRARQQRAAMAAVLLPRPVPAYQSPTNNALADFLLPKPTPFPSTQNALGRFLIDPSYRKK